MRVHTFTAILVLLLGVASPCLSQEPDRLPVEARILIMEQSAATRDALDASLQAQLTKHRQYLQDLDDKFYERMRFWLPVASTAAALLLAIFLWQVGKTQKEAFETAQLLAVTKATELATQRVNEIVIPENVTREAQKRSAEALKRVTEIRDTLINDLRDEFTTARDQVVADKHAVIMEALDEAMKERFSGELNVLGRVREIETALERTQRQFVRLYVSSKEGMSSSSSDLVAAGLSVLPGFGGAIGDFYRALVQHRKEKEVMKLFSQKDIPEGGEDAKPT